MKILHVITSLRTGGAEKLMVDLLPRLRRKDDEVDLLLFDGTPTPFLRQLEDLGIRIFSLSIGENVYNPMNIFRLRRFIHGYDIVHTHNTACQLFVPLARLITRSKPLLFTTEHSTSN
ncbi:MAG: glycosyltransferase, partial [bacterium]|nr:glycosyltransferase [bacterium]